MEIEQQCKFVYSFIFVKRLNYNIHNKVKDSIQLNQIKFYAYHGVVEQERKVGNTFLVDIKLYLDLSKPMETDDLSDTVNYAEIYEIIKEEMAIPSNLLEHVAGRIAKKIKHTFPFVEKVKISLAKERPPIKGEVGTAVITLTV